jgi:hypothetical protein
MNKLLLVASAILAVSCGSDNQSVSVGNTNPLGTVGGVVLDAGSEMPIMGAMVTLVTGAKSLTATTDMNGLFSVSNVPSGNFIVTVTNSGFESAMLTGVLNGAVGNFPVKDPVVTLGPIGLVKNDGTFAVKIVDQFGAPVANVAVTARTEIRWVLFQNGQPVPQGSYEITGTSGMDGIVMLAGLPNYVSLGAIFGSTYDQIFITVPPTQVMGSTTIYTFLGGTFQFDVGHLDAMGSAQPTGIVDQPIIRLAGPDTALSILNSSLDILRGLTSTGAASITVDYNHTPVYTYTPPNGPITIEFNQVVNKGTLRAQLFDESGQQSTISLMAAGMNNVITITPMSALTAATRYSMALHVDSNVVPGQSGAGRELNVTVPIFTAPASGTSPKVLPASTKYTIDSSQNVFVDIIFSEPIGTGFGNTSAVSCIAYYELAGQGLDNDPNKLAPGEWPMGSTTGIGVSCPNAGLDITGITPVETGTMPQSGFSSHWRVKTDAIAHPECIVPGGCIYPSPPPTMHLLFSKLAGDKTFKRPDGTPVADNLMNFSFTPVAGP